MNETFEPQNYIKTIVCNSQEPDNIMAESRTSDSQYRMLLISDRISYTPSLFLNKEALDRIAEALESSMEILSKKA